MDMETGGEDPSPVSSFITKIVEATASYRHSDFHFEKGADGGITVTVQCRAPLIVIDLNSAMVVDPDAVAGS